METIIDIEKVHLKTSANLLSILEQTDIITIQVPLHSIHSTNSYIDIIIDYIEASYIAECIAQYSERKDIQINHELFFYPVVHIMIKPMEIIKLSELLFDLSKGFNALDDDSRLLFVSAADQHEEDIENKVLVYPELIDDYYANLINGAYYELAYDYYEGDPNDDPDKILSKYLEEIFSKYPERKFGFWKSAFSKNIKQDFYCSTEAWIIPNSSDLETIVKEYSGIENLQFIKADLIVIDNISYIISNGLVVHFPFDILINAKHCSCLLGNNEYSTFLKEDHWMTRFLTFNRAMSQLYSSKENYRGYPEDRTEELITSNKMDGLLLPPNVVCFYLFEYGDLMLVKDLEYSYLFFGTDKLTHNELLSLENRLSLLSETTAKIYGIQQEIKCSWEKLNDEKFEELCYDIIYHSPKFDNATIRKMGKSRSRDGGRDIVVFTQSRPGYQKEKYIFQCKYLQPGNSLTANKVKDISDTIEQYNAQGYGIMTSVVIDATLYDRLDAIATKKRIRSQEYSVYELERILARQPALKKRHFKD